MNRSKSGEPIFVGCDIVYSPNKYRETEGIKVYSSSHWM
nr:MAG TPA: hypothetical protein [Caudoviricetes sp.]